MTCASATHARTNGTAPATGLSDAMRMILGRSWDSSTLYTSLIQMKIHKHVFTGWGGSCRTECKGNGVLLTSGP